MGHREQEECLTCVRPRRTRESHYRRRTAENYTYVLVINMASGTITPSNLLQAADRDAGVDRSGPRVQTQGGVLVSKDGLTVYFAAPDHTIWLPKLWHRCLGIPEVACFASQFHITHQYETRSTSDFGKPLDIFGSIVYLSGRSPCQLCISRLPFAEPRGVTTLVFPPYFCQLRG